MYACGKRGPLTGHDALAGQHHDRRQADAENRALPEVQHGQRGRAFQRRGLVRLQKPVVPLRFVVLVIKILQKHTEGKHAQV